MNGDPVAWIAIEQGAIVVAADGSEVGKVEEVAGDEERDIFDGLVVKHSRLGAKGYIAAERVKAIYAERVETDLTPQEAESLPPYAEPKTTVWHADTGEGRFKRAFRDLFGRRR